MAIVITTALPGQGPATSGLGDTVCAITDHENGLLRAERKEIVIVLQQNERFPHGAAGDLSGLGRCHQALVVRSRAFAWRRLVENAIGELHTQDTAHGIVETLHRDVAILGVLERTFIEPLPAVRCHVHIEPSIQRLWTVGIRTTRHLAVTIPVTDDKTSETEAVFQHFGQHDVAAMHLDSLPAGE